MTRYYYIDNCLFEGIRIYEYKNEEHFLDGLTWNRDVAEEYGDKVPTEEELLAEVNSNEDYETDSINGATFLKLTNMSLDEWGYEGYVPTIDNRLYQLSNGNHLRICVMCDDPEYEFGVDYFDGKTKKLIDGGVFNIDENSPRAEDLIVAEAMRWFGLDPEVIKIESIIINNCEYSDLEDAGYTGF